MASGQTTTDTQGTSDAAARKAEAEARKAEADANKAASDAEKAAAEASLAALKAKIGEVPASGISGNVELKDKAGVAEANLLAARAAEAAAGEIVERISGGPHTIVLYAATEVPSFQELIAYKAQIAILKKAFEKADTKSDDVNQRAPAPAGFTPETPFLGAAGLALSAVSNLLGFFRTDFTVGGVEISPNDSLLVHALAGRLAKEGHTVVLPGAYNPDALSDPAAEILNDLADLSQSRNNALTVASFHDKLAAELLKRAEKTQDPVEKKDLQDKAKLHQDASDAQKAVATFYDDFFKRLTTASDKGLTPLTQVVRDAVVHKLLSNDSTRLLLIKMQSSGGSYYTRKNLWTFFGGKPFFHMGSVVVSFVLLEGKTGHVKASGVIPVHGGFVQADQLEREINNFTLAHPAAKSLPSNGAVDNKP
ncbi:MAG: hypothetical protein QOF89_227 [Acidobacteriota bacterium]|jgi:hypothetical protein|nr:hypothetical protein [Acidobacteriota bacterium]